MPEEWEPAFDYHMSAGRQAQDRYANREAITLYERGLQIVPRLGAGSLGSGDGESRPNSHIPTSNPQVIELHERLGLVHALIGEYDAALEHYQAALGLLQQHDPTSDGLVRLHHHIVKVYGERGDFETALEWVERALAL